MSIDLVYHVVLDITIPRERAVTPYKPPKARQLFIGSYPTDSPYEGYVSRKYASKRGLSGDEFRSLLEFCCAGEVCDGGGIMATEAEGGLPAPGIWPSAIFSGDLEEAYSLSVCPVPVGLVPPIPEEVWVEAFDELLRLFAPDFEQTPKGEIRYRETP